MLKHLRQTNRFCISIWVCNCWGF